MTVTRQAQNESLPGVVLATIAVQGVMLGLLTVVGAFWAWLAIAFGAGAGAAGAGFAVACIVGLPGPVGLGTLFVCLHRARRSPLALVAWEVVTGAVAVVGLVAGAITSITGGFLPEVAAVYLVLAAIAATSLWRAEASLPR